MLTVVIEQMYPTRKYLGQLQFDDRGMTVEQVTEVVEQQLNSRLWEFNESYPDMTQLRWEYEEHGQGHYIDINGPLEPPITWTGHLSYEQMVDVINVAVKLQDWRMAEDLSYQLKLMQDTLNNTSWQEFVLIVDLYKFDWMDNE